MGVIRRLLPTHVEEDVKASKQRSTRQGRYSYSPTRNITSILIGFMAVLLFLMTPAALGCRYTFSYMATENSCVKDGETEKCTYENTTLLEMIGHGETCLLFKTTEKAPAATATFEVLEMAYECNPPIVSHYTKSFTAHTEFIKRCPSKGSCVEQGCANQKRDVPVPELDGANAKFPGKYECHS
uniref:Phlebovirus glycoprotein G2 fusion domain-containing protein n=1 Tax=Acrobeloides nanus TaxID=290746 RepID=A0A914D9E6_9BILA